MSVPASESPSQESWQVLTLSTMAFTLLFSVWLMLGVLNIPMKRSFGLSDSQVEWLMAAAILAGALPRMLFGIWADRFGGRRVNLVLLLFCAVPTYLMGHATSYSGLLACTLLFGLAGNSFTAGISWNSAWFPRDSKGFALGVFGAGNVGASGTKLLVLLVPTILTFVPASGLLGGVIPGGWRFVPALYSILLILMALAVALFTPKADRMPGAGKPTSELLAPLRYSRVWRFSLYYIVVFGAYVALSGWLPKYYVDTYQMKLRDAALLTALFIFPASLLRPVGGWLSDLYGPRLVTYSVFIVMIVALVALCIPDGTYAGLAYNPGPGLFTVLLFVVGCGMGIGKASVYKYVPDYYPEDVGAVGGLVGALGALGGFVLPPLFGYLGRATGNPRMAFLSLLVLALVSLAWLHAAVLAIKSEEKKALRGELLAEGSTS
jgi:NNP family nitrate/nitrite transporter-like MFS transporter